MTIGRVLLLVVLGGVLLPGTATRVGLWQHPRALWIDATYTSPDKPRPWINAGREAALAGDVDEAEADYRQALRAAANPLRGRDEQVMGRAFADANLGLLLYQRGKTSEGGTLLAEANDRAPGDAGVTGMYRWFISQSFATR